MEKECRSRKECRNRKEYRNRKAGLLLRRSALRVCLIFITTFVMLSHPVYAAGQTSRINPDFEKIDRYIEEQMKEYRIPGLSFGVVQGDQILYMKGYGKADNTGRVVTPQTPFIIGSVSKPLTALAILQLAEEGRIDLDRPVREYISWFELADEKAASAITVRQLLSHTSGIGTDAEWRAASAAGGESIAQLVRKMRVIKPEGQPGSSFRYSNANYIILGEIIQKVTGTGYEDYMQKRVFEPLSMKNSFADGTAAGEHEMAAGYRSFFGYPQLSKLPYRQDFAPAYYLISSVEDMTHYMLALLNDGKYGGTPVISRFCLDEMFKPAAKVSSWGSYGAGWYLGSSNYFHGGATGDFEAKVNLFPRDRLGVVILYNTSDAMIEGIFKAGFRDRLEGGIINLIYGEKPILPPVWGLPLLGPHPIGVAYILYTLVAAVIAVLLAFSLFRTFTFSKRLHAAGRLRARTAALDLLIFGILPVFLLFQVPVSFRLSWPALLFNAPDAGGLLLAACVILLLGGGVRGWGMVKFARKPAKSLDRDRGAVG